MPTMRVVNPWSRCSVVRCSRSSETNRRATLPNPTRTRSKIIEGEVRLKPDATCLSGVRLQPDHVRQQLVEAIQTAAQVLQVVAESNPQVAVHPEVIARHD